jgi:V/A-type H+-transporting ATPase subunit D
MSQQILKVRPTKIELVNLKRRLSLAERVQKIVKDRLSILTMEFLQAAREAVEAREKLMKDFNAAYKALSAASGYHGYMALEKEMVAAGTGLKVDSSWRNIAGVRVPSFEMEEGKKEGRAYSMADTSSLVDEAGRLFEECLKGVAGLAEAQRRLELLGMEINRSKRTTNALEHIIIPGLRVTISYLKMKFEERDREEKGRLKRVKMLVAQE